MSRDTKINILIDTIYSYLMELKIKLTTKFIEYNLIPFIIFDKDKLRIEDVEGFYNIIQYEVPNHFFKIDINNDYHYTKFNYDSYSKEKHDTI